MSPALAVRVDAEALVRQFLLSRSEVAALVSQRVGTRVDPQSPSIRLYRLGGLAPFPGRLDHPRIQFDCYGKTDVEASDLCGTVRSALSDIVGVHPLGTVTSCDELVGETHLPDPLGSPGAPARERFLFTVSLTIHPNL